MQLKALDHLVLTVADIDVTVDFYTRVLGMQAQTFGEGRQALCFGSQKINLHQLKQEFEPKAGIVQAGSADLCFLSDMPLEQAMTHVQSCGVAILQGPIRRTGAKRALLSFYIRDPDGNLLEIAQELME